MTRAQQLALVITGAILALVAFGAGGPLRGGPGEDRTDRYEAALGGIEELEATISQGAGVLRVETIDSDRAYEATITRSSRLGVRVEYRRGELRIRDDRPGFSRGGLTNNWTVAITRRVPVDLEARTGAGQATMDLTGLKGKAEIRAGAGQVRVEFADGPAAVEQLEFSAGTGRFEAVGLGNAHARRIEARAGVGELHLDFSGSARDVTQVEINGGVGRIIITVPDGLGVRVFARRGATSGMSLSGFTQRGQDEYVNAAWETAPAKVDIRARLGVGQFEVQVK